MTDYKVVVWDHDSPAELLCTTDSKDKADWIAKVFEDIGVFARIEY